jgi:hypothetical protein
MSYEHWACWCSLQDGQLEHDIAEVQRCPECGDYAPDYHFRPVPEPYWWDWLWVREQRVRGGIASSHERSDLSERLVNARTAP